ncbi:MAG: hypothetical protein ACKVHE_31585 [Planctomycetales bacterium]
MRREAERLGFVAADEKIANVDGASRIRNQLVARPDKLPLDGLGLDFYHVAENVHKNRRLVFGDDSEPGRKWADELLAHLQARRLRASVGFAGGMASRSSREEAIRRRLDWSTTWWTVAT